MLELEHDENCDGLEHQYRLHSGMLPDAERSMTFYHDARVDGLEKRVETPTQMTEYFVNRDDFLVYRLVEFAGREKRFGPSDGSSERPIQARAYVTYFVLEQS